MNSNTGGHRMAERHLILCDGIRRKAAPRSWQQRAHVIPLEIGSGADIHVMLDQLTDRMCEATSAIEMDLLELAAFVYAADQVVSRGGTAQIDYGDHWRRPLRFEIPVRCPEVWNRPDVRRELTDALEFLTDDIYEFGFHPVSQPRHSPSYLFQGAGRGEFEEVVLFSGGLDSLCGAVEEVLVEQRRILLVSHRSSTRVGRRQDDLFAALQQSVPKPRKPLHVPVTINKGEELNREFTQRSRSFVYATVGAIVARLAGLHRIRFYENGVTSLNLPVSSELVGARASRTTHPQVLARFGRLFSRLFDTPFTVENRYQWRTKAGILAELLRQKQAHLASQTCMCCHVWGVEEDRPHCGRCSQCVDRRLSVLAAGLTDTDDSPDRYASDPLVGERSGSDLTFAERYVGVAGEISQLATPLAFAVRFPEVNAALGSAGCSPAEAARRCHDLYRRHAEGVKTGIEQAITRIGVFHWQSIPAHSLLGVVLGRSVPPPQAPSDPTTPVERGFVVDRDRFEVRYRGIASAMGNTREFALVERLHRARGVYLSIDTLRRDVWNEDYVLKNTIQRIVSNARRCLVSLGLPKDVIDGANRGHYRLVVPTA